MRIKICTKCEEKLSATLEFFRKNDKLKSGLHCWCRKCCKDYNKKYRKNNIVNLNKYNKRWTEAHNEELKNYKELLYQNNKQLILEQKKAYYKNNKKIISERDRKYRQSEKGKRSRRIWTQSERGRKSITGGNRRYQQTEKGKKVRRLLSKKYYERNKLSRSISGAIRRSLKNDKANKHWEELVPYTLEQLKEYLENLFQPNMSWSNYGEWHIDHIKPISKFNIISYDCKDFKECWSLCNLQPLWRMDNLKKSNKYQEEQKCF